MRNRWWAAPAAAGAVALLAACGSSGTSSSSSGGSGSSAPAASSSSSAAATTASTSASGIKTASASGGTVLTNAQGFTIYWFAIDTPTKSNCSGTCATFWPPLIGKPSMASGSSLTGTFGTIKRANGQLQATYDGHPLYLYKGDTAAGEVHGNGVNTAGGLWWAMTPSAAKLAGSVAKASASASKSGGSGGYGY